MPAEAQRLTRGFGRRDLWLAVALAAAAAIATPVVVVAGAGGSSAPVPAGCVSTQEAGVVGGATVVRCGREAVRACAGPGAAAGTLGAQCERLGLRRRS